MVEALCILALCCIGLLLLPFVGPFCVWSEPRRPDRGGFYDHHPGGRG